MKETSKLTGMKAIVDYYQRSEPSILRLIMEYGFPAVKVLGIWESDKRMIEKWRIKHLKGFLDDKRPS